MKTRHASVASVIVGVVALLVTPAALRAQAEAAAVMATIQAFAEGAAKQDVLVLERALHPAAIQFVAGNEIRGMDRPTYLAAIRDKKMGGVPLEVQLQQLHVEGATAQALATFSAAPFTLSHALSLVKSEGRWVIVSSVVRVLPKEGVPPAR